MRTYGKYNSQFTPGVMQKSQSNPGGGHHGANAYFKISAGNIFAGKMRYDTVLKIFISLPKYFY